MKTFANTIAKVFYGTLIHSVSITEVEYIKQGLLFVDNQGRIAKLLKNVDQDKVEAALDGVEDDKVNIDQAGLLSQAILAQPMSQQSTLPVPVGQSQWVSLQPVSTHHSATDLHRLHDAAWRVLAWLEVSMTQHLDGCRPDFL